MSDWWRHSSLYWGGTRDEQGWRYWRLSLRLQMLLLIKDFVMLSSFVSVRTERSATTISCLPLCLKDSADWLFRWSILISCELYFYVKRFGCAWFWRASWASLTRALCLLFTTWNDVFSSTSSASAYEATTHLLNSLISHSWDEWPSACFLTWFIVPLTPEEWG